MKESSFRQSVLTKLPDKVYSQPMLAGGYGVAGTPDTYFDAKRDLWVEWKCLPREDYLPPVIQGKYLPTGNQRRWMARRFKAGGNVLCVIGLKLENRAHGIILTKPEQWSNPLPREVYEPMIVLAKDVAAYIASRVL